MSSEQYKKTTTTTEPLLGSINKDTTYQTTSTLPQSTTTYVDTSSKPAHVEHTYGRTVTEPVVEKEFVPVGTTTLVHPTGHRMEPTKSHVVTETAPKKWSEEASMVGSDVREGLGKYKDVRPATGATDLEQTRATGNVYETGFTDASVYRVGDMTDTATKEGSDQREGFDTTSKRVEKEHKHKHETLKHDATVLPAATYTTEVHRTTTSEVTPSSTYPGPPTASFGTSTTTGYGSAAPRAGDASEVSYKEFKGSPTKFGSDQREDLGSGSATGNQFQ